MNQCKICNRHLKNPKYIELGMGPVCARKNAAALAGESGKGQAVLVDVGSLTEVGLVCRDLGNGVVACNIPQAHRHHSPTGFSIGYGGSGPADLALNVLAALIPITDQDDSMKCWDGTRVSGDAWRQHQLFKWTFIANMPEAGGTVPIEKINMFLADQREIKSDQQSLFA